MDKLCLVFVCNKLYFEKFVYTCDQLIRNGKYQGDICLIIGDDLNNDVVLKHDILVKNNVIVKYFPNIEFTKEFLDVNNNIRSDGRNISSRFQWHKLYLFDTFFKNWDYMFYVDCGMHIFSDISPMIASRKANKLLAHYDNFPFFKDKLGSQFDETHYYFKKLSNKYNLEANHFQTGMMLYSTSIIEANTFSDLCNLMLEYPFSMTNEQPIIALYFIHIKPCFQEIKLFDENTRYYDMLKRKETEKYIMVKGFYHHLEKM